MDRGPKFYGIFFLYAFTISRLAVDFLYNCILYTGTVYKVPYQCGTYSVRLTSMFGVLDSGQVHCLIVFIIAKLNKKGTGNGIFKKDLDPDPDGQK